MKFLHLGVAVRDLQRGIEEYERLFGCTLRDGPYEDPLQRVAVCFVRADDGPSFELGAPLGAASPVTTLLQNGTAAYHTCYAVPDLEAAVATLREQGCVAVHRPCEAVAFGGRRIVWLYTPSRQLVELVEAPH